ncbi:MAG TPA: LppP/LprE family lipoprotein [Vicinamibacteria bacterium]|nr:LppP/LprE family lipoprotein [Vicinamibacteria bacterium]
MQDALLLALALAAADPRERALWLEATPLPAWNKRGAEVPKAPPVEPPSDPRCDGAARPAASKEDRAVVSAGWSLVGAAQVFAGARLLLATAGHDGMCRPLEFQGFVFLGGRLAGLLSPTPMRSRTDGALVSARLLSETTVEAEFARYLDPDPLCCPSRTTVVHYRIEPGSGEEGPLLVAERSIPAAR